MKTKVSSWSRAFLFSATLIVSVWHVSAVAASPVKGASAGVTASGPTLEETVAFIDRNLPTYFVAMVEDSTFKGKGERSSKSTFSVGPVKAEGCLLKIPVKIERERAYWLYSGFNSPEKDSVNKVVEIDFSRVTNINVRGGWDYFLNVSHFWSHDEVDPRTFGNFIIVISFQVYDDGKKTYLELPIGKTEKVAFTQKVDIGQHKSATEQSQLFKALNHMRKLCDAPEPPKEIRFD